MEWTMFISPGYYLARYYKNYTDHFNSIDREEARAQFIKANNIHNWLVSSTLFIACNFVWYFWGSSKLIIFCLSGILFWRFISRSFEITYAFGCDAVSKKNSTGLDKFERIRLALISYSEVYLYSASFYLAFFPNADTYSSITTSLNVGTLTNVGYPFPTERTTDWIVNFVFVQVVATLSLVVLSLASYLSRDGNDWQE